MPDLNSCLNGICAFYCISDRMSHQMDNLRIIFCSRAVYHVSAVAVLRIGFKY